MLRASLFTLAASLAAGCVAYFVPLYPPVAALLGVVVGFVAMSFGLARWGR